jgi:hypothetical protein
MTDGSPVHLGDGCSNLANSSQGRNKSFSNIFCLQVRDVDLRAKLAGYSALIKGSNWR